MKSLKFYEGLPELILNGTKTVTWRINDEKNISVGDEISLCRLDGNEFAKAAVVDVKVTTFGGLANEDRIGHDKYGSNEEMYANFSKLYSMQVDSETMLKIIKFRLML